MNREIHKQLKHSLISLLRFSNDEFGGIFIQNTIKIDNLRLEINAFLKIMISGSSSFFSSWDFGLIHFECPKKWNLTDRMKSTFNGLFCSLPNFDGEKRTWWSRGFHRTNEPISIKHYRSDIIFKRTKFSTFFDNTRTVLFLLVFQFYLYTLSSSQHPLERFW